VKKLLIAIIAFGFASTASANNLEVQISSNNGGIVGGTSGGLNVNSEELGDNSPWGLQGEAYYGVNENIQVGGMLAFGDRDATGAELGYTLGVAARYNLDTELRDSIYFGVGVAFIENGLEDIDSTSIGAFVTAGKRFALSDNLTYTPNVTYTTLVGGDDGFDEGSVISVNLLSFSGFMNL